MEFETENIIYDNIPILLIDNSGSTSSRLSNIKNNEYYSTNIY